MKEDILPYLIVIISGVILIPLIIYVIIGICYICIFTLLNSQNIFEIIVSGTFVFDIILLIVGTIGYIVYDKLFKK